MQSECYQDLRFQYLCSATMLQKPQNIFMVGFEQVFEDNFWVVVTRGGGMVVQEVFSHSIPLKCNNQIKRIVMQGSSKLIERHAKTQAFTRTGAHLCSYVFSMSLQTELQLVHWAALISQCSPAGRSSEGWTHRWGSATTLLCC